MVYMAASFSTALLLHRFTLVFPLSNLSSKLAPFHTTHHRRKLRFHPFDFRSSSLSAICSTTQFNSHRTQLGKVEDRDNLVVLGWNQLWWHCCGCCMCFFLLCFSGILVLFSIIWVWFCLFLFLVYDFVCWDIRWQAMVTFLVKLCHLRYIYFLMLL